MLIQYRYRMRAGNPMPATVNRFFYQTFMAEKIQIDVYEAKKAKDLLVTDDFRGRGGNFISASYNQLPYKDLDGDKVFSATEEHIPEFIEEEEVPGS